MKDVFIENTIDEGKGLLKFFSKTTLKECKNSFNACHVIHENNTTHVNYLPQVKIYRWTVIGALIYAFEPYFIYTDVAIS